MTQLRAQRIRGRRPRLQLRRKELSFLTTNRHVFNNHYGAPAARARGGADEKLEALGTVPIGTTMGDGSRRLFTIRKLLGLFSARPCTKPRVSLGRGRKGALLLSRLDADPFVHEGALQISAGRISVRPINRGESPARLGRTRARTDRYRRF